MADLDGAGTETNETKASETAGAEIECVGWVRVPYEVERASASGNFEQLFLHDMGKKCGEEATRWT